MSNHDQQHHQRELLNEGYLFEFATDETGKRKLETDQDGALIVTGILQRADAINQNGRVYPYAILHRAIMQDYTKLIRENRAFGQVDHIDSAQVETEKVSHMITDIWFQDKTVYGKVKIFPTIPYGQNLIIIIKHGGVPGISSRSLGSVKHENGVDVVQEDLEIVCWDFVTQPSTHGAFMYLSEAKEFNKKPLIEVPGKRSNTTREQKQETTSNTTADIDSRVITKLDDLINKLNKTK